MNRNAGDGPTPAEERRADIRFFIFALLFYLFSLFAFAATPLLAMPLQTAIFDRYYLPAIETAIEEKYGKPPHAEEAPVIADDAWAEPQSDTVKDDQDDGNDEKAD